MNILIFIRLCFTAKLHKKAKSGFYKLEIESNSLSTRKSDITLIEEKANRIETFLNNAIDSNNQGLINNFFKITNIFFTKKKYDDLSKNFDALKTFCILQFKNLANKIKNEIVLSKTDQVKLHPIFKIKKKAENQMNLYRAIKQLSEPNTYIKITKTEKRIIDFIENHEKMTFYRYYKNLIFKPKYDSFDNLYNFFRKIIDDVEIKIEKLQNSLEFKMFIKNSIFNNIHNAVINFKKNSINNTNINDDKILIFRNDAIKIIINTVFKDLNNNFQPLVMNLDQDINGHDDSVPGIKNLDNLSKDEAGDNENIYENTFNNKTFIKNVLIHLKNTLKPLIYDFWEILIKKEQYCFGTTNELVYIQNSLFSNFYNEIFTSLIKSIETQRFHYSKKLLNLSKAFKNKPAFTTNDLKSIYNIILTDYLIVFENGIFFNEIIEENLDLKKFGITNQILLNLIKKNVLISDYRSDIYNNEILKGDTIFKDIKLTFKIEKCTNEFLSEPIMTLIAFNILQANDRYVFLDGIFTEDFYNLVFMSYDIYKFRSILFDSLKNPKNEKYEIYQVIYYLFSKFDYIQSDFKFNHYICNFNYFKSKINKIIDDPHDCRNDRSKTGIFLINKPGYFINEYKNHAEDMIEKLFIALQNFYYRIFPTDCDFNDCNRFVFKIKTNVKRYLYLGLVSMDNYIEMKNIILEKFIDKKHDNQIKPKLKRKINQI